MKSPASRRWYKTSSRVLVFPWKGLGCLVGFVDGLLDVLDVLSRVEALGAGVGAVEDGLAAVELERIVKLLETVGGVTVTAISNPAVSLHEDSGA